MYEVSKCPPQEALRDLDKAFTHFFRRVRLKKRGEVAWPAGLSQVQIEEKRTRSLRLTGAIHVFEKAVQLPRLGRLRLKEAAICQPVVSSSSLPPSPNKQDIGSLLKWELDTKYGMSIVG